MGQYSAGWMECLTGLVLAKRKSAIAQFWLHARLVKSQLAVTPDGCKVSLVKPGWCLPLGSPRMGLCLGDKRSIHPTANFVMKLTEKCSNSSREILICLLLSSTVLFLPPLTIFRTLLLVTKITSALTSYQTCEASASCPRN